MISRALVIYLVFSLTASLAALALAWWAGRRGPLPEGSSVGILFFGTLMGALAVAALWRWL